MGPAFTSVPPQGPAGASLLDPRGARVMLGGADPLQGLVSRLEQPTLGLSPLVKPSASSLFGPRGAYLFGPQGPLFVADTGHHRVLGWHTCPTHDGQAADFVLGQPDFANEARNSGGVAHAGTMNVPTGVGPFGQQGLFVCDAWNSRVLIWKHRPTHPRVPADIVLGQADAHGELPNRGGIADQCGLDTMHWPFQALCVGKQFIVADTGNRRLLVWDNLPTHTGQAADRVIGQPHGRARHDNGGQGADACSFRWPHDLAMLGEDLAVTDAGNNRILIWDKIPSGPKVPAKLVLGQKNLRQVDHNQGGYWPKAQTLNMPYAIAAHDDWLWAADTASSRLVGWQSPTQSGAAATGLSGQPHFCAKGDNRWGEADRSSLCWPYGLQLLADTALVCDTGNHRILLWDRVEEAPPPTHSS